jgi:hypothetical protein
MVCCPIGLSWLTLLEKKGETMKEGKLVLAGALLLAVLGSTLAAQEKKDSPNPPSAKTAQSPGNAAQEGRGAHNEGIKVHGRWTVDIRNPDGSLVSHNEFENSLSSGGAGLLPQLLARKVNLAFWQVILVSVKPAGYVGGDGAGNVGVCDYNGDTSKLYPCYIAEPGSANIANSGYGFLNLTVSVPTSGANAGALVLAGNAKAALAGAVSTVKTWAIFKDSGGNLSGGEITSHDLAQPINVQPGQSIDVTVVISFS